jgi:TolB-like protein
MKKQTGVWIFFVCLFAIFGKSAVSAQTYFEGDGGKGISIAVLQPEGKNLGAEEQGWLPLFVQGTMTTHLKKFSAMTVIDRQNEKVIKAEQELSESGYYSEQNAVQIGNMINAQYILVGSLLKMAGNQYSLQLSVSNPETAESKASYSGQGSLEQIQADTLKTAAGDILGQLGIRLNPAGRQALTGSGQAAQVEAETALSKGISAQRSGTVVEALSYYYDAVSFDPDLAEASGRLSILSSDISSGGNIGENVRNDIQRRNEWLKILKEAETYFKNHPPFEIVYDPTLTQGQVNYERETVDMSFSLQIKPTTGFNVLENIRKGLVETGKMKEWGFSLWPLHKSDMFTPYSGNYWNYPDYVIAHLEMEIIAGLFNEQNKQLSMERIRINNAIGFYLFGSEFRRPLPRGYLGATYSDTHDYRVVDTTRFSVNDRNARAINDRNETVNFRTVNANDITDNLTVKIISVNGIDAETAGKTGYIKISTGEVKK